MPRKPPTPPSHSRTRASRTGEATPTDWEAKYREAVSRSREWEKRAKDNKAAADEL
ncbi:hypothetical protein [Bifidobacterium stellenboschense]|uniref:Uncharacterized protein n=1 Tax=Bifidobacterium stellenboschense TaxID=762211 RepID=A0A087DGB2_9BIFI|nr:hypothetical protein [Bifidobacterium stellenboschense]KFI94562.1 hypothetical protein BSTEL_1232 [Bifidobacterium stellenboschense]